MLIYFITNFIRHLNWGGPYIDFPDWIKNKKATINAKNNVDKCFQYAAILTLDFIGTETGSERI